MIVGMTCPARNALSRKTLILMALGTRERRMFAKQRKAGQRVVEGDFFLPAYRIVTTRTVGTELALVHIVVGVAAYACDRELYRARRLFVAGIAFERLVRTAQRKASHRVVVEIALLPVTAIVAARAIGSIATFMRVILGMARYTRAGRLPGRVANAVAGRTACASMLRDQGKSGIPTMIERRGFPARCGMAARAVGSTRTPMDIILCVACYTLARCARPTLPGMTGKASSCAVPASERKACSTMIEQ